jgi:hypothetical protein
MNPGFPPENKRSKKNPQKKTNLLRSEIGIWDFRRFSIRFIILLNSTKMSAAKKQEKLQNTLKELRKDPDNKECFVCKEKVRDRGRGGRRGENVYENPSSAPTLFCRAPNM